MNWPSAAVVIAIIGSIVFLISTDKCSTQSRDIECLKAGGEWRDDTWTGGQCFRRTDGKVPH